jgi:alpha-glucosidase
MITNTELEFKGIYIIKNSFEHDADSVHFHTDNSVILSNRITR